MLLSELYYEGPTSSIGHEGHTYDINKLFRLVDDKPLKHYNVSELKWILKHTKVKTERLKVADKKDPILVTKSKGKLVVLDGAHRLTLAVADGDKKLPGKYVTPEDLEAAKK